MKSIHKITGIISSTAIAGLVFLCGQVSATCTTDANGSTTCNDSSTVNATVVISESCSFSSSNSSGEYFGTLTSGSSIIFDGGTFTTSCNSLNGYAIYARGFSNDTLGNTVMISNVGSTYNIPTGTSGSDSYWAMRLATSGSTDVPTIDNGFDSFHVVPSSSTMVAHFAGITTSSKVVTSYQVKASITQPAGQYVGQVKYTLVPTTTALSKIITDLTYMQDFASLTSAQKSDVLASMTTGEQYQLKDSRDEKDYWISKLADGNVWMTQNLDFDIDSTKTYTPSNTDISANWTPDYSTKATGDTTWNNVNTYAKPGSYDPGNLCWNDTISTTGDTLSNRSITCTDSAIHHSIGNYYNWAAAIATNDSSSYTTDGTDVNQSICPAGWRLPTKTGDKSYQNLVTTLSLTSGASGTIHQSPVYFVYGGRWTGSSTYVGYYGLYWSSTVHDSPYAYELTFYASGSLSPQSYIARPNGASVRCVAR